MDLIFHSAVGVDLWTYVICNMNRPRFEWQQIRKQHEMTPYQISNLYWNPINDFDTMMDAHRTSNNNKFHSDSPNYVNLSDLKCEQHFC